MKCPACPEADLVLSERQSIEIDYCPKCRGVWLDRGELDKIIERANQNLEYKTSSREQEETPSRRGEETSSRRREDDSYDSYGSDKGYKKEYYGKKHKKKSFFDDIFDWD